MDYTLITKLYQCYIANYKAVALPILHELSASIASTTDQDVIKHAIERFTIINIHNAALLNMEPNNSIPALFEMKRNNWYLYNALTEKLQKAAVNASMRAYRMATQHNEKQLEKSQRFQNAFSYGLFIEFCIAMANDAILCADLQAAVDQIPHFDYTSTDLAKDMYRYLRKLQNDEIAKFTNKLAQFSPDDRDIVRDIEKDLKEMCHSFSLELSRCRSNERVHAVMFKYQFESSRILERYQIIQTSNVSWQPLLLNLLLVPLVIGIISMAMKLSTGKYSFFDKPYLIEKSVDDNDFNQRLMMANNYFITG